MTTSCRGGGDAAGGGGAELAAAAAAGGAARPLPVPPRADRAVVEKAVGEAVQAGKLWLLAGQTSLCGEVVPAGAVTPDARLLPPTAPVPLTAVLPEELPDAWRDGATTAAAITDALSRTAGWPLPWPAVRAAVDAALRARRQEKAVDCGPWPCEFAGASAVRLCLPAGSDDGHKPPIIVPPLPKRPGVLAAEAELKPSQVQDLAEQVGELADRLSLAVSMFLFAFLMLMFVVVVLVALVAPDHRPLLRVVAGGAASMVFASLAGWYCFKYDV